MSSISGAIVDIWRGSWTVASFMAFSTWCAHHALTRVLRGEGEEGVRPGGEPEPGRGRRSRRHSTVKKSARPNMVKTPASFMTFCPTITYLAPMGSYM